MSWCLSAYLFHRYIGSVETWHGSPNTRVRGAETVYRRETEEMYQVSEITSDIRSDYNESCDDSILYQAFGTCVVASFTEKLLHPDMSALVPTIIINDQQFRVCLYDCEKDVLLLSDVIDIYMWGG